MKDFSGDGKITQKDVLMGRGVIDKPPMKKMSLGGVTVEDTTKTIDVPTPMPTVMQQNKMNRSKIKRLKNLRNVSGQGAPKSKPKV